MKKLILTTIMLGWVIFLYGQDCSLKISGVVLDDHTEEIVVGAKVAVKNSFVKAVSDSSGQFVLAGLCPGQSQLVCLHHVGCEPFKMNFNLTGDTSVVIRTETHFLELDEFKIEFFVLDKNVLSTAKLSEDERFNRSGNTLGKQLEAIPGVSTLSTGNSISKPVIHGLHSNRVILLNNEIRQEGQQWGSEHAPEVDPFLSSDISVIKGASALRYGPEAIGGVISVNPPEWKKKVGWSGNAFGNFSSNGRQAASGILLENNSKKINGLFFRGHVSAKKAGNIAAPNYFLGNTGLEELNFSLASKYEHGKHEWAVFYSRFSTELGIFSGAHIGNLSDLQAAINSFEPAVKSDFTYRISSPKQEIKHDLFKLSWNTRWNKILSSKLSYGYQQNDRKEFDTPSIFSSVQDSTIPDFRLQLYTHTVDLEVTRILGKKVKSTFGAQGLLQGNERAGRYLVPNFYKNQIGAFALVDYSSKKWNGGGGLRYDVVQLKTFLYENNLLIKPEHLYHDFSSSLGVSRTFGHHLVLKSSVGYAWRPPSISELYSDGLHHGAAAIETGDRSISEEKSIQGNLTGIYKSRNLNAQVDLYHLHFMNFIYLKPQNELELTIKGAFPSFQYEELAARFSGIDFILNYAFTESWMFNTKYSLVRAINTTENKFLVGIPSDRWKNGISFSRTFSNERIIQAEIDAEYAFKQERFETTADYSDPPSDYVLLNGNVNYQFKVKENKFRIGVVIENALNKEYRNYMNRFRYYTAEMGRNVSLKISYEFI